MAQENQVRGRKYDIKPARQLGIERLWKKILAEGFHYAVASHVRNSFPAVSLNCEQLQ